MHQIEEVKTFLKCLILFFFFFFVNREDTIYYHGRLQSRKLGQALMLLVFLTPRQALSSHPLKQMVWLYWIQDRDRIPNWCTINDPTTLHIQWNPVTHCCWPMAFCTAGCILQMVFVSVLDTESPMVFLLVGLPHLLRLDIYYVILPQHFTTNICIKQCRKRNLPQWRAQAKMKLP